MQAPTPIVLVTGPPASGKTFVARLVAERLGIPLIEKDAIKETLYETLGTGDVGWSRQLGRATAALMCWALETQLKACRPVVLEANFAADDARPEFRALGERRPLKALELHCTAPDDVLLARYAARAGTRHPGHLDAERMPEIAAAVRAGRYGPLGAGDLVVVDTTSFDDLDLEGPVQAARTHLHLGSSSPSGQIRSDPQTPRRDPGGAADALEAEAASRARRPGRRR